MKNGYYSVVLSRNSSTNRKRLYVHEIVTAAFIGPRPAGLHINHKDGIKTHSWPANLEYVTLAENTRHAVRLGLFPRGERAHSAKLNEMKVRGLIYMSNLSERLS
jgi:hypothetical protein